MQITLGISLLRYEICGCASELETVNMSPGSDANIYVEHIYREIYLNHLSFTCLNKLQLPRQVLVTGLVYYWLGLLNSFCRDTTYISRWPVQVIIAFRNYFKKGLVFLSLKLNLKRYNTLLMLQI